jgi:hypothetical protein
LNQLERIGRDANFRYSNISDLGSLLHVGGNLSLRDTPINSLGNLRFVGGNLFLPIRLKDQIDLSKIRVIGRVQYWNDSKSRAKPISKTELGLTISSIPVPYWKHGYIYSVDAINQANPEQKKFYEYFKSNFLSSDIEIIESHEGQRLLPIIANEHELKYSIRETDFLSNKNPTSIAVGLELLNIILLRTVLFIILSQLFKKTLYGSLTFIFSP